LVTVVSKNYSLVVAAFCVWRGCSWSSSVGPDVGVVDLIQTWLYLVPQGMCRYTAL